MAIETKNLITELERMDEQEARIHGRLLRQLEQLEGRELRERSVTVADLQVLQTAIDELQAKLSATRAAAASPAATPTFAQLEAQVREHDATAQRVRELLAERLGRLAAPVVDDDDDHDDEHGAAATYRIQRPLLTGAGIRAFQGVLNGRYEGWGIHRRIAENGVYGPETREAAQQIALGFGLLKSDYEHGITPQLRVLLRHPERRSALQRKRFQSAERKRYRAALRKRYAAQNVRHAGPQTNGDGNGSALDRTGTATGGGVAAAIRRHGGRWEDAIVREARNFELPVSLVCAVIEKESGFTNVFGHDSGPGHTNTIKSPPRPAPDLVVTQQLYAEYLRQRNLGKGEQGVGPMQLTSAGLQDDADRSGGCWKPEINIRIGAKTLARHIARLGLQRGVQRYNGAEGLDYSTDVLRRKRKWDTQLAGASSSPLGEDGSTPRPSPGPAPAPKPAPGASAGGVTPTFRLQRAPLRSARVLAFQRVLNTRFASMKIGRTVAVDGVYGVDTARAARQAALALGLLPSDYERGVTPRLRVLIRTPKRRSAAQKQRARSPQRIKYRARLRKRYGPVAGPAAAKPGGSKRGGSVPGGSAAMSYPLGRRGTLIGTPFSGTHTIGNWQSDNAVDISVPVGTAMLAIEDGRVVKLSPHPQDGSRFAGDAITIRGDSGNAYFYKHGVASVKAGDRVKRGQKIGTSGSASGSPHLHLGVQQGDPRTIIGQPR